ncbi:hypothetical protein OTU49_009350, partial [Cherax quadricarinatus]
GPQSLVAAACRRPHVTARPSPDQSQVSAERETPTRAPWQASPPVASPIASPVATSRRLSAPLPAAPPAPSGTSSRGTCGPPAGLNAPLTPWALDAGPQWPFSLPLRTLSDH